MFNRMKSFLCFFVVVFCNRATLHLLINTNLILQSTSKIKLQLMSTKNSEHVLNTALAGLSLSFSHLQQESMSFPSTVCFSVRMWASKNCTGKHPKLSLLSFQKVKTWNNNMHSGQTKTHGSCLKGRSVNSSLLPSKMLIYLFLHEHVFYLLSVTFLQD